MEKRWVGEKRETGGGGKGVSAHSWHAALRRPRIWQNECTFLLPRSAIRQLTSSSTCEQHEFVRLVWSLFELSSDWTRKARVGCQTVVIDMLSICIVLIPPSRSVNWTTIANYTANMNWTRASFNWKNFSQIFDPETAYSSHKQLQETNQRKGIPTNHISVSRFVSEESRSSMSKSNDATNDPLTWMTQTPVTILLTPNTNPNPN